MPTWTLAGSAADLGSVAPVQGLSTVYTPPTKVTSTLVVTLTAQLNEATFSVTITVEPAVPMAVAGHVVDDHRTPVAGAKVEVPGLPVVTTDANGAFAIPGVSPPYDLYVNGFSSYYVAYQELRRADPTAMLEINGVLLPPYSALVTGHVSGGAGFPPPAGTHTIVGFGSAEVSTGYAENESMGAWALVADDGSFSVPVPLSAAETTGTLYALEYQDDGTTDPVPAFSVRYPSAYTHAATRGSVHLTSGATVAGQDMTLGASPGTSHVSGTASYAGWTTYLDVDARFGNAWLPVGTERITGSTFDVATPSTAEEIRVSLRSGENSESGWYFEARRSALMPNASGVSLGWDGYPNPTSPADGALVSEPNTPFTWQPVGTPRSYVVRFDGPFVLTIISPATWSVTIPDLSDLGIMVPSPSTFHWSVAATNASLDMDDLAGPEGYRVCGPACLWQRSIDLSFHTP